MSAELIASLALLLIAVYIVYRQIASGRAERALRETDQFAAEILDNAGEGIVVYDRDFRYRLWNRFMEDLTGIPAEDIIGKDASTLFPHLREQGVDELVRQAMEGQTVAPHDIEYRLPGSQRSGWVSAVYRPHYDATGNIVGAIGLIRDITERKSAEEQMQYQAYHDALTGLANRRLFSEHLTLALAQPRRRLVGVLFRSRRRHRGSRRW
jgi:PAS domain S-box-containing protein